MSGKPQGRFLERLYAKIGPADPVTGCRPWLGAASGEGYGRFRIGRGRAGLVAPAHVVVWEVERGREWPRGLEADHFTCFRHECVEPAHLRATTP